MDQSKPKKGGLQYQKNLYNGNVETTQFPPAHKTCMESSIILRTFILKKIITINWKSSMFSIFFQSFSTLFTNFNILDLLSYLYFAVSTFCRFDVLS